jgi:hypothetical protein
VKLVRSLLLAAVTLVGAVSTARADIVIDSFDNPLPGSGFQISSSNPNPTVNVVNNVTPGVNRTITLNVTSPATPQSDSLTAAYGLFNTLSGPRTIFTMNLNLFSTGTATLRYDYASAANFIPNVAAGGVPGALQYLYSGNAGFGGNIPLTILIGTATGNLNFNGTLPSQSDFAPQNVNLSSFSGSGDLTQVNFVQMTFSIGQAGELAIDQIGVTTPPPPNNDVPAPPAAILALLAAPALALRRRMNRKEIALA